VAQKARDKGIRVEINTKDESMGAKIRNAQIKKVPYMFIVGGREEENGQVSVRLRTEEDKGAMVVSKALDKIEEIKLTRSLKVW